MNRQQRIFLHRFLVTATLLAVTLTASRGLLSPRLLAGHDAAAYAVTQHQFHANLKAGVLFPRWAPDMRHGYGHIKLQYRPPLLHYIAEPVYAVTGNPFAAIHAALLALMIAAGSGMYALGRIYAGRPAALAGAVAYVTFNYLLANLYVRGAYYEVAAYAWMPWILWAQDRGVKEPFSAKYLIAGGLAWTAMACGHPQTLTFFAPVALAAAVFNWNEQRSTGGLAAAGVSAVGGLLLAAPYLYVAYRELPFVRMELFFTGLQAYTHHFISLKTLLTESWPSAHQTYAWTDYLGRPRHLEMRGLNGWALMVLAAAPCLWFGRLGLRGIDRRRTLFVYACVLGSIFMLLPAARGIWSAIPTLHTFNFPWRILAITGLFLCILLVLMAQAVTRRLPRRRLGRLLCIAIICLMGIHAWRHGHGWQDANGWGQTNITREAIMANPGIPQQFYTPRWVSRYAPGPTADPVRVIAGQAQVRVEKRDPVSWHLAIQADSPASIVVAHYYYPGWMLHGIGDRAMAPTPIEPTGEMMFTVPTGSHRAVLHFGMTRNRWIGYALAAGGLLLLVMSPAGRSIRKRRPGGSGNFVRSPRSRLASPEQ